MKALLKELIESHRFFVRRSQHYVLGNWAEYVTDKKALKAYRRGYPKAYIKFMWLTIKYHFNKNKYKPN